MQKYSWLVPGSVQIYLGSSSRKGIAKARKAPVKNPLIRVIVENTWKRPINWMRSLANITKAANSSQGLLNRIGLVKKRLIGAFFHLI